MAALWMLIIGIIYGSSVLYVAAPYLGQLEQAQNQLNRRDIYDLGVEVERQLLEVTKSSVPRNLTQILQYNNGMRFFGSQHYFSNGGETYGGALFLYRNYTDSQGFSGTELVLVGKGDHPNENLTDMRSRLEDASANACGDTAFAEGGSWCLSSGESWLRVGATDYFPVMLSGESARLKSTITKFYRRYSGDGKFTDLADGSVVNLAAQSGYLGTEDNCSGVYLFDGVIPLTCMDMFNSWGGNIILQVENSNSVVLVNETSIIRNGQNVVLAEEAKLE